MPRLLQINATLNWGSTGRIAEQLGNAVQDEGWESFIAYGRYSNPSSSHALRVGRRIDVYVHYFCCKFADREGLASKMATRRLIHVIERINPDIIHLHNIHDHYINYPILFSFLKARRIPVVWTLHDCWSFTGGCGHFGASGCLKWTENCGSCWRRKGLIDKTSNNLNLKRKIFGGNKSLILVPVSQWLAREVGKSFLSEHRIIPVYNGVDTDLFRPSFNPEIRQKYHIGTGPVLLAAATAWSKEKGLDDYLKLAKKLNHGEQLILVGIPDKMKQLLPNNIVAIGRTHDISEMVQLYSLADVVLNLSYQESFGLTTVEGLACGTPGIVYNKTASPELIDEQTGIILEPGDIDGVYQAISSILLLGKASFSTACRERAIRLFDKRIAIKQYTSIYHELLK